MNQCTVSVFLSPLPAASSQTDVDIWLKVHWFLLGSGAHIHKELKYRVEGAKWEQTDFSGSVLFIPPRRLLLLVLLCALQCNQSCKARTITGCVSYLSSVSIHPNHIVLRIVAEVWRVSMEKKKNMYSLQGPIMKAIPDFMTTTLTALKDER